METRHNRRIKRYGTSVSKNVSAGSPYERYIDTVVRLSEILFEHNCQNKFARLKMDNYIHKHKAIDKFFTDER